MVQHHQKTPSGMSRARVPQTPAAQIQASTQARPRDEHGFRSAETLGSQHRNMGAIMTLSAAFAWAGHIENFYVVTGEEFCEPSDVILG